MSPNALTQTCSLDVHGHASPSLSGQTPIFHRVYGLYLAVPKALPGFPVLHDWKGSADVQLHLGKQNFPRDASGSSTEPFYVSRDRDDQGNPVLLAAELPGGKYFLMSYSDGARFLLDRNGGEIYADWPESLTLEDACVYLAGPVLGFLLHLRGVMPLHASCVSVNGHAIALMGAAGAGKSTTAAAFAQFGCRVIADDVVALTERQGNFVVSPGYPRVNLWRESARALFGDDERLPLITPNWDKRFMALDPDRQFEKRDLRLGAIYVLRPREPGLEKPVIEGLVGNSSFVALIGNVYMNRVVPRVTAKRELAAIGRLATRIPIRAVRIPADPGKLILLLEAITKDVAMSAGSRREINPAATKLSSSIKSA